MLDALRGLFSDFNNPEQFERLGVYIWHKIEPTPGADAATHAEMVAGLRRGLVDDGLGDLVDIVDMVLARLEDVQRGMRAVMAKHWETIHGPQPVGCEEVCNLSGTHLEKPQGPRTMAGLVMGAAPGEVHASGPTAKALAAARDAAAAE